MELVGPTLDSTTKRDGEHLRSGPPDDYTPAVGRKFKDNGEPRHYPGNSVISFVPTASALSEAMTEFAWSMAHSQAADTMAILPRDSWHMTVHELICDQVRVDSHWSQFLSLDAELDETDAFLSNAVASVLAPPTISVRFVTVRIRDVIALELEPYDDESAATIRHYREQIATVSGLRFADHDTYQLHASIAYLIRYLNAEEALTLARCAEVATERIRSIGAPIVLPAPEFVYFSDMASLDPKARPSR